MRLRHLTLPAAALALALPALAQTPPAPERPQGRDRGGWVERIFEEADANRDGRITFEEMWAAVSARHARADAAGDGGVTRDEARAYFASEWRARTGGRPAPSGERLARMEARGDAMFRALDADGDGRVTLNELRPFAEAMFRARDTNDDGAITREELRARRDGRGPGRPQPTAAPAPSR